jgi:hypothetical protein
MSPRLLHLLLTVTTLVVGALVWLAPTTALASEASFAGSFAPAPAPVLLAAPSVLLAAAAPSDRAPLCDPRGAITFAPPPQMQDVEVSLDSGLTLDDCFSRARDNDVRRANPGPSPVPLDASSASSDAAVIATAVMLAACARELLPAPAASTSCSRPGIRSTVDRPPRA